jgi:UDP-N-acetylglucosamine 2-epimerase (non-hydrolysing)
MSKTTAATPRVCLVFGTRPEAIKMAPVALAFSQCKDLETKVLVTAQHREMLDQVLRIFKLEPDFDLNIMKPGQDLFDVTSAVLLGLRTTFQQWRPDLVLVHGDTTTTFATSLACFYLKIPVAHVEAGLRTHNLSSPWPEEFNRQTAGKLAALHFAPTPMARDNLLREGADAASVAVTGNTVIDTLMRASAMVREDPAMRGRLEQQFAFLDPKKKLVLVTGHRRENFGDGFENICRAIAMLSGRNDVEFVYPVHFNPNVREPVERLLANRPNVHLIEPLDYLPFVYLMQRAYLILTDSGGIQEEAPSLGKPVLVMRDTTERPEAIAAGTARLVGTSASEICAHTATLLDDAASYQAMAQASNPFGDGRASERIVALATEYLRNPLQ